MIRGLFFLSFFFFRLVFFSLCSICVLFCLTRKEWELGLVFVWESRGESMYTGRLGWGGERSRG